MVPPTDTLHPSLRVIASVFFCAFFFLFLAWSHSASGFIPLPLCPGQGRAEACAFDITIWLAGYHQPSFSFFFFYMSHPLWIGHSLFSTVTPKFIKSTLQPQVDQCIIWFLLFGFCFSVRVMLDLILSCKLNPIT